MIGRLLAIDRDKLNFRLAVYALVGILLASVFEVVVGVGALQSGVAAVVVVVVGRAAGNLRTRMVHMIAVTLIGGAFGFFSYVSADTAWQAALVLGVVTYLTGLAYGLGPAVGRAGYLLILWTLVVLIGVAEGSDPPATAAAFLVGGVAAIIVVGVAGAIQTRRGHTDPPPQDSEDAVGPQQAQPSLTALVKSDLGWWSLLRAVLTMVAVVIGYSLTGDGLDPYWTPMALLIVFQPDFEQTLFKALQRGLGTLVGVATSAALIEAVSSDAVIVVVTLIVLFGAVAFYSANYMIYAFFITNSVLLYYWLAVDQVSSPEKRLAATIIGIALAMGGMALVALRIHRRSRLEGQSAN